MKASHRVGVAALAAILSVGAAEAKTTIRGEREWTPGGQCQLETITMIATSDAGNIIGFNFDSGGRSGLGFQGPLVQVDPFGLQVIFNDLASSIYELAGTHIKADTHFLVASTDGIHINAAESGNSLSGAFIFSDRGAQGSSLAFAQLVHLRGSTISFAGDFTVATPTGNILERVSGEFTSWLEPPICPEPSAIALAGLGVVCLGWRRRRASAPCRPYSARQAARQPRGVPHERQSYSSHCRFRHARRMGRAGLGRDDHHLGLGAYPR